MRVRREEREKGDLRRVMRELRRGYDEGKGRLRKGEI